MLINESTMTIYLGDIEDALEIQKICDFLNTEERPITIDINSCGGDAYFCVQLMNALNTRNECFLKTTIQVSGVAESAAAIIALQGSRLILLPGSCLFFHDIQINGEAIGEKSYASYALRMYQLEHLRLHLFNSCKPFLEEEEINQIFRGEEILVKEGCPFLPDRMERHYDPQGI